MTTTLLVVLAALLALTALRLISRLVAIGLRLVLLMLAALVLLLSVHPRAAGPPRSSPLPLGSGSSSSTHAVPR